MIDLSDPSGPVAQEYPRHRVATPDSRRLRLVAADVSSRAYRRASAGRAALSSSRTGGIPCSMMRLTISDTLSPYVLAAALIASAVTGSSMITICSVYLAGGDGIFNLPVLVALSGLLAARLTAYVLMA